MVGLWAPVGGAGKLFGRGGRGIAGGGEGREVVDVLLRRLVADDVELER